MVWALILTILPTSNRDIQVDPSAWSAVPGLVDGSTIGRELEKRGFGHLWSWVIKPNLQENSRRIDMYFSNEKGGVDYELIIDECNFRILQVEGF